MRQSPRVAWEYGVGIPDYLTLVMFGFLYLYLVLIGVIFL